jgi:hypothetical protein
MAVVMLPNAGVDAAPEMAAGGPENAWAEMVLAGIAGRAMMGGCRFLGRPTIRG